MSRIVSAQRVATLVGDFPRSPAYLGLAESLRVLIGDGRIGIEVRLPSERDLTAAQDWESAVLAYNRSGEYVDDVLAYAHAYADAS